MRWESCNDGAWLPAGACSGDWLDGDGTVTAVTFAPDTIVRENAAGGDWHTAANWNPAQVPDGSKTVAIDNMKPDGTMTVTVASDVTAAPDLSVGAGAPFAGRVALDVTALWPFTRK